VHLASDPSLDRPVAVKLLRARADAADLRRLHREARTLARLAHPHVVHVYEVGEHDDHLFLVMEYVDGGSLLDRQRDPNAAFHVDAIVTAYTEAAEGLAAAHAAGIVHRDVKPANLLIGTDGRVRVADFGLAHPVDESTDPRRALRADDSPAPRGDGRASAADDLAGPLPPLATDSRLARGGTPAYMAPETLRDGIADARSDQFSWAMSFFEALYGRRIDSRGSVDGTSDRPPRIIPSKTPTGERVPGFVRAVLERALAPAPADRAPTLNPLISALRSGPSRARRSRASAIAGALVVATGAAGYSFARVRAACPSPEGLLDGTWDATIAARIESNLRSADASFAATAAAYAVRALDDYGSKWRQTRVEVCELTRTRAERSDAFLGLANACLETRRAQLDVLVEQLSSGGLDVVANVTDLVATLSPLDDCTNPSALESGREAAFDRRLEERFAKIRESLSRARLAFARGAHVEALRLAEAAALDARDTHAKLILAEALLVEGELRRELGDGGRAQPALLEALDAAEAVDAPSTKVEILVALARVEADLNEDVRQSKYHVERARATLTRLGVDPEQREDWLVAKAAAHAIAGETDSAIDALEQALSVVGDGSTVEGASIRAAMARHLEADAPVSARAHYRDAAQALTSLLGAEHPKTLNLSFNVAFLDQRDGHLDLAQASFERLRASLVASQGPDAPRLATVHTALADLAIAQGDPARAIEEGARALAIEATLPFQEPTVVAAAHTALSNAHRMRGDADLMHEHLLAAYEIQRSRLRPRELVEFEIGLGEHLCSVGSDGEVRRCGEARPYYLAALEAVRSDADALSRRDFAYAMNGLGKVALYSRAFAEAASSYLVAHEIGMRDLEGRDALLHAEVHWGLAQARSGLGAPSEAAAHALVAFAACVAARQHVAAVAIDGKFTPTACVPAAPDE
jgi:tetratricopeptide (TPR) repeat protein